MGDEQDGAALRRRARRHSRWFYGHRGGPQIRREPPERPYVDGALRGRRPRGVGGAFVTTRDLAHPDRRGDRGARGGTATPPPRLGAGAPTPPTGQGGRRAPAVGVVDLPGPQAQGSHRREVAAQEAADLQALGARTSHGALADGRGRWRAPGGRHRVQDPHGHRRPLALYGLRRHHDEGDLTPGLRALRGGPREIRRARGDLDGQRQGLHEPFRTHSH